MPFPQGDEAAAVVDVPKKSKSTKTNASSSLLSPSGTGKGRGNGAELRRLGKARRSSMSAANSVPSRLIMSMILIFPSER